MPSCQPILSFIQCCKGGRPHLKTAAGRSLAPLVCLALLLIALPGQMSASAQTPSPTPNLQARLALFEKAEGRVVGGRAIASHQFLPKLYAALNYELIWSKPEAIKALASAVARSWEDGLNKSDFHAGYIEALAASATGDADPIERDLILSDALVRLLHHLFFGKVNPNSIDPHWNFTRPVLTDDPIPMIAAALRSGDVASLVEKARLKHPLYTELRALLQQFTQYEVAGGWAQLPAGPAVKPGGTDPRIPALRQRLRITGEYQGGTVAQADTYDPELAAAVETFQSLHGLEPDGVLGASTVTELNVTATERIEQIRVNLERARWLLRTLGPDSVIVNVAGYYLHLFLKGEKVWTTRVIVGSSFTKTPIFTETMKTIVFNPDWTVPRSIVRNEIFPKASADPGYLAAHNYYLADSSGRNVGTQVDYTQWTGATFPYKVVQKPGPRNALGLVKFLFPNKYSVYLHDTPGRQMFAKSGRTFSHGCIRVEDPLKLAELILGGQPGWDRARIDAAVATGKLQNVALTTPLPVLLLYWTVDPSPAGGVFFHRDDFLD